MAAYVDTVLTPPRVLSEEEQETILKVTGEHVAGFRDHVIISVALGTGLREHEIAALTVGDILGPGGHIRTRITLNSFKRSSSTPAPQTVVPPPRLRAKLDKFIAWKRRRGQSLDAGAPLFVSKKKNPISARAMRSMFRKWQLKAGIERLYTFHSTRHTACTSIYRETKDLRLTQVFARHKSPATTERYTHPTIQDLIEAVHDLPC
jgi:integrase/recombinase XerC